jgi:hypothetical protein
MRANAGILLILGLLLLVGTVGAYIPDKITFTSNPEWVVANGVDQSTIMVIITNQSNNLLLSNSTVTFTVTDSLLGTMNPMSVTTNSTGEAKSNFKVKTKSGNATITVAVTNETDTNTFTIYQKIDHNSAYFADFTHPMNGTVASEVPFTVSLTDQYRNPVDNRRGNHIVNLHVHGPYPDDCGFAEAGYAHDISPLLDANGNTSVNVKLTSKIGDNNIAMDAYQSIPNQLAWISAEAKGKPFSITQVYSPSGSPPSLPADGVKYFTIIYNLFDEYGNPTNKQFIWVNTSISGEEKQFLSNNMGQVTVQYGPRSSIGEIDITATSVANSTLTLTQRVKFKNTAAEIISLTANPDTMPSQDANPSFTSNIIATVADISGNAVAGETVNFTLENITYDGLIPSEYNVTADPNLLSSSAITDVYGRAAVQFKPGSFTTIGNLGYNSSATGHSNVNATWKNSSKKVPITWKNYPYLSVSTKVTPLTVEINKTIDVTIEFKGDGWAIQSKPVDVILLIDNSGSMGHGAGSRLESAKAAAKTFVNQLNISTGDRVAVMSYNNYITQTGWITDKAAADTAIDNILKVPNPVPLPNIDEGKHTRMREALKIAITKMRDNGRSNSVNAIIHMTDGDWSMEGTPLATGTGYNISYNDITELHKVWAGNIVPVINNKYKYYDDLDGGTATYPNQSGVPNGQKYDDSTTNWNNDQYQTTQNYATKSAWNFVNAENSNQNMSVYAKNSGLRLYGLSFVNLPGLEVRDALNNMALNTGAFYEHAPNQTRLEELYKQIAIELKNNAGVNTAMTADFDKVNVTGFAMDGDQVYDYVYHQNESTKIRWQDGITNVTNQSLDWQNDSKLDFNIGTIKVGQYWNATFRLKVKQSGLIDVFGKNSTVSFNSGHEKLYLPQTFITVVPNLTVTEIGVKTITLDNLTCTETVEIKALIPVMWNTNYTGNKTLTEKVYYRIDDQGPWVQFDIKTHLYDPLTMEYVDYAQLDVTKLPPGSYQIMVYATASDAPDATKMLSGPVVVGNRGKTYIKLE